MFILPKRNLKGEDFKLQIRQRRNVTEREFRKLLIYFKFDNAVFILNGTNDDFSNFQKTETQLGNAEFLELKKEII